MLIKLPLMLVCLLITACGAQQSSDQPRSNEHDNDASYNSVPLKSQIKGVAPMTGIVLWQTNDHWESDRAAKLAEATSLEYRYIRFSDIVDEQEGIYDWTAVERILDDIASRNHQAILRLYYVYIGNQDPHDERIRETTVPQYIKNLPDYNNNITGYPEGELTHFPDWSHPRLQQFNLDFHTAFAARYDQDPRLAFLQVGFGLWAEYHIYDGIEPELGVNFPSKNYQSTFINHMDEQYLNLPWSISVDAHSNNYSPFTENPNTLLHRFGLFDDSFMHRDHLASNEPWWAFFNYNERYQIAPMGGEFSYYEYPYEQHNALNPTEGAYGISYEDFAEQFYITYMIGNDTPEAQSDTRIKEASMASGYRFEITQLLLSSDKTIAKVTVTNIGIAPIYYDAYITVNGHRASQTLKALKPNNTREYTIQLPSNNNNDLSVTIESDHILESQTIEYNADL